MCGGVSETQRKVEYEFNNNHPGGNSVKDPSLLGCYTVSTCKVTDVSEYTTLWAVRSSKTSATIYTSTRRNKR